MAGSAFHLVTFRYHVDEHHTPLQVTVTTYADDGRKVGLTTFSPGPFDSYVEVHDECDRLMTRAEKGTQLRLT